MNKLDGDKEQPPSDFYMHDDPDKPINELDLTEGNIPYVIDLDPVEYGPDVSPEEEMQDRLARAEYIKHILSLMDEELRLLNARLAELDEEERKP